MKKEKKSQLVIFMHQGLVRAVLSLTILGFGLDEVKAAILWNWVSVGEGNTFTGSLTTDGDYSMTLSGSEPDLVTFNVLSFDSWILNGTNLVDSAGPFQNDDWQMEATPTGSGGTTINNAIKWSRSDQRIDPDDGLNWNQGGVGVLTSPAQGSTTPEWQAALLIANPDDVDGSPMFPPANLIRQYPASGLNVFDWSFVPSSTVFTPVPEPEIYVGCTAIGLSVIVCFRRTRANRRHVPV